MKIVINLKLDNWNDIIKHCRYNKYSANNIKQNEMKTIAYYLRDIIDELTFEEIKKVIEEIKEND